MPVSMRTDKYKYRRIHLHVYIYIYIPYKKRRQCQYEYCSRNMYIYIYIICMYTIYHDISLSGILYHHEGACSSPGMVPMEVHPGITAGMCLETGITCCCACIHLFTCVLWACIYVHTHMYIYIYIYAYIHICVCICICLCICILACTYVNLLHTRLSVGWFCPVVSFRGIFLHNFLVSKDIRTYAYVHIRGIYWAAKGYHIIP